MLIQGAALVADAGFTFGDVIHEYVEFVGTFFIVGAISFYFLLLRPALAANRGAMNTAARIAARIGVAGALLRALAIGMSAGGTMAAKHVTLLSALTRRPSAVVGELAILVALLGFVLASRDSRDALGAWSIAAIATIVVALRGVITTDLHDIVNPVHVFAASMWIGTLFVLVVAGLSTMLSQELAEADRGPLVAVLVGRFSTIALWAAGVLILTGVTTATLHLGSVSALWTSIYGKTLIAKLCVVACVISLGAYNNRRLKPTLGTADAGARLRRSASFEIALAAVVLGITAVLVKLPAPAEHLH
jgi:putative copper export protein